MRANFKKIELPKIEPAYISGDYAHEFLEKVNKTIESKFKSSDVFRLRINKRKDEVSYLEYESVFDLYLVDKIAREDGNRVLRYEDQIHNTFFIPDMFKENMTIDFPQLLIQNTDYVKDVHKIVFDDVMKIAKRKNKNIKNPFLISGLEIISCSIKKGGYGITFRPINKNLKNVEIIEGDWMRYKTNNETFSDLNSKGFPLTDYKGKKEILVNRYEMSVLSTNKKGEFYARCTNLVNRGNGKRVIIVRNRPTYKGEQIIQFHK